MLVNNLATGELPTHIHLAVLGLFLNKAKPAARRGRKVAGLEVRQPDCRSNIVKVAWGGAVLFEQVREIGSSMVKWPWHGGTEEPVTQILFPETTAAAQPWEEKAMSVNLPNNELARRATHFGLSGPLRDILIFFGGWFPGATAGHDLTIRDTGGRRSSDEALEDLEHFFIPADANILAMDPACDQGGNSLHHAAITRAMQFLLERFDPRGKLVLYGFSAGAFNALRFSERIERHRPHYNFQTRTLGNCGYTPGPTQESMAEVRVDLLLTVDPCLERLPGHESFSTQAPSLVIQHVNWYQTRGDTKGRWMAGARNHHVGASSATVGSYSVTHDNMPRLARLGVRQELIALFQ